MQRCKKDSNVGIPSLLLLGGTLRSARRIIFLFASDLDTMLAVQGVSEASGVILTNTGVRAVIAG